MVISMSAPPPPPRAAVPGGLAGTGADSGLPDEREVLLDSHASVIRPVAVRSEGIWYVLSSGERILDASGMSAAATGHSDPAVAAAIARQASTLAFVPRQLISEPQLLLGAKIRQITAGALSHSWFAPGGGAGGVESAVHAARAYHLLRGDEGRHVVISWQGSYHGGTMLSTCIGGYEARRRPMSAYLAPGAVLHAPPLPAEGGTAGEVAAAVEELIAAAGARSVAAVVAEPVTGSLTGALTGPPGGLHAVRQVCTRHGVLLVADETMTGFGRTGAWFATVGEDPPVVPDILVSGKLLTGGHFPLSAVMATGAVNEVLESGPGPWDVRYTNAGHPVGCAAALAVIGRIEDGHLLENAARQGAFLRGQLAGLAAASPHLGPPTGRGLQLGVPVRCPGRDPAALLKDITLAGLHRHGILLTGGTGADGKTVKVLFTPSLTITEAECGELAGRFAETVDDVAGVRHGTARP
jgi:adenosylmethionine-8-amino-7-oxononanoate aminotransferase